MKGVTIGKTVIGTRPPPIRRDRTGEWINNPVHTDTINNPKLYHIDDLFVNPYIELLRGYTNEGVVYEHLKDLGFKNFSVYYTVPEPEVIYNPNISELYQTMKGGLMVTEVAARSSDEAIDFIRKIRQDLFSIVSVVENEEEFRDDPPSKMAKLVLLEEDHFDDYTQKKYRWVKKYLDTHDVKDYRLLKTLFSWWSEDYHDKFISTIDPSLPAKDIAVSHSMFVKFSPKYHAWMDRHYEGYV